MKKKWIYIEPFVFIWQDNTHYLFYNSLNGKKAFFQQNDTINPIVQSLSIEKNTYCIQLEEDIENKKDIVDFIRRLASNQLGNLVICSDNERPVNIPPKLNLEKSVDNPKYNNEYYDELILGNINELTIQVSGECNFNCNTCDEYHLQLIHCCKSGHFLTKSNL